MINNGFQMHRISCFYSVVGHLEEHDIVTFSFFKKKTMHLEKLCILLRGGGSEGLLLKMTFMAIWIWASLL